MEKRDKNLRLSAENASLNEASGQVHPTPQSRSNRNPHVGGAGMASQANIRPCGDSASEHTANTWKSIAEIAHALAEKSGGGK